MSSFPTVSQVIEDHPRLLQLVLVIVVVALVVSGVIYAAGGVAKVLDLPRTIQERLFPEPAAAEALPLTGVVEAETVEIASEFGGHIVAMPVAEGNTIAQGDVLIRLDASLLEAKIGAAEAALALARAALAQAEAGARPGQLGIAEAQLDTARVGQEVATDVLSSTLALVDNPQEVLLKIAVAQAELAASEHDVAQAVALKDAAQTAKNEFEEVNAEWGNVSSTRVLVYSGGFENLPEEVKAELPQTLDGTYTVRDFEIEVHEGTYDVYREVEVSIPLQFQLTPNDWWRAWVGVNAATAEREGQQRVLGQLYAQYNDPLLLQAQADEAAAALVQAEAGVAMAEAGVAGVRAGATTAELAALEARVAQAETVLDGLRAQRALMAIEAPMDGVVLEEIAHEGETVAAGSTLLLLADLSTVDLVVYIPESLLGRVRPGQRLDVIVSGAGTFSGEVVQIAGEAEFTPRNVSTPEERVTLVFAVTLRLDNEEGRLKPGMSASIRLPEGES